MLRTGRPPTRSPPPTTRARVNLLNWDGKGRPPGCSRRRADGAGRRRAGRRTPPTAPTPGGRPGASGPGTWPRSCCSLPGRRARPPCPAPRGALPPAARVAAPLPRSPTPLARPTRPGWPPTTWRRSTSAAGCCLYLTYYTHGDTRKRGMALLTFKQAYRGRRVLRLDSTAANCPTTSAVVLEFAATADATPGGGCCGSTAGLELLPLAGSTARVGLPSRRRRGVSRCCRARAGRARPPPAGPAVAPPGDGGRSGTVPCCLVDIPGPRSDERPAVGRRALRLPGVFVVGH